LSLSNSSFARWKLLRPVEETFPFSTFSTNPRRFISSQSALNHCAVSGEIRRAAVGEALAGRLVLAALVDGETYVDGLMASTFFALNGLVGCGHMSGLVARRICPLALMKSDDQKSLSDLRASSSCLTTGCFWSSVATVSFIAFQCAWQTSNCDLRNCSVDMLAGRAASLRLREYFGAESFAGPHYRPDDPGELSLSNHSMDRRDQSSFNQSL
jgi:hypothetical protein